jgi:hypothetical protein
VADEETTVPEVKKWNSSTSGGIDARRSSARTKAIGVAQPIPMNTR